MRGNDFINAGRLREGKIVEIGCFRRIRFHEKDQFRIISIYFPFFDNL